jgi:hypothetical protein
MFVRARAFMPDCTMPAPFTWLPAFDTDGETGGGSGETPPAEPATGDSGEVKVGPNGYPEKTPWRDMQPEHQAAYWRHQAQSWEGKAKTADGKVKELEPRAQQFAALEEASRTEADRAIEQARREAHTAAVAATEAAARAKYGSVLVGAEFRVQLAGKLTAEQVSTLVGGLDVTRFLTEDGQPDTERIGEYVAALPAAQPQPAPAPQGRVNLGQGARPGAVVSGLAQGAELYTQRHQKRNATA